MCATRDLPDSVRGYVNSYHYFESSAAASRRGSPLVTRYASGSVELSDRAAAGVKMDRLGGCDGCLFSGSCNGVWTQYLEVFGEGEFAPVRRG